jgi:lysyl-tRNA synthetase class 2
MATIEEIKKARLQKLERIKKKGLLAYPGESKRTHSLSELLEGFSALSKTQKEVIGVGRIRTVREHGGSTFFHIEDGTGQIQAYIKKDRVGETPYQFFLENIDIGDFVQLRGVLFSTKKGEKTIEVADYKILAKSLFPLPEKWHGIQDVEERYRKRYLDLLFNNTVKKKFETRSAIIKATREFLDKEGFLEVETSILQPIPGGASARPFQTHLNALNMDLYLRVAPELDLKKLLVGGFERVYEIGRSFRNEGMDYSHNPEFTSLEFYYAYVDYKELMKFTEKLFVYIFKKLKAYPTFEHEGKKINLAVPWPRVEFTALLRKYAGIDYDVLNRNALQKKAESMGIQVEAHATKGQIGDHIYKKACKPKIKNPLFIIHQPLELSPLAKPLEESPAYAARFQLVIDGWELVNAFSELNDPLLQRKVFEEQEKLLRKGDVEAQRLDETFVEALEYGMPPAAGFAFGIDRLTAFLTDSHSLREVILFPTMKPR